MYQTKTGVRLTVIDGQGLGDGIPRGRLYDISKVSPKPKFPPMPMEMRQVRLTLWGRLVKVLSQVKSG